jgi:hypothetical protein
LCRIIQGADDIEESLDGILFLNIFWKSFSEEECVKKNEYDVIAKFYG